MHINENVKTKIKTLFINLHHKLHHYLEYSHIAYFATATFNFAHEYNAIFAGTCGFMIIVMLILGKIFVE